MNIKPLKTLHPGQKYWTFDPRYGESAKIRFDVARDWSLKKVLKNVLVANFLLHARLSTILTIGRQNMELYKGLCFATKEEAIKAKEEYLKFNKL